MSPRHYRPPTKPLATAWARHLDRVMRARDLSQTNVFDAVRVALGYGPNSRSAVLRVFSDREPSEELAAELTRLYGAPEPEPAKPEPAKDESEVAAAIRAQTAAIKEQTALLAQLVERLSPAPLQFAADEIEALRAMARTVPRHQASRQETPTG